MGLFIVLGMLVMALVAIPAWRWFFGAAVLAGSLMAYGLWRHHQPR